MGRFGETGASQAKSQKDYLPSGESPGGYKPEGQERQRLTVAVALEVHQPLIVRGESPAELGQVVIGDAGVAVVSKHSELTVKSYYKVQSVGVDFDSLCKSMNQEAREAFKELRRDPDNAKANRRFRNALTLPGQKYHWNASNQSVTAAASGEVNMETTNCNVVLVGGCTHATYKGTHVTAHVRFPIEKFLKCDAELVRDFAIAVEQPSKSGVFERRLGNVLDRADDLTELLDPALFKDGTRPRMWMGGDFIITNETAVTIVGENTHVEHVDPIFRLGRLKAGKVPPSIRSPLQ